MDILNHNDLEAEVLFDDDISFEASLSSCCCCCTAATSEMAEEVN
jgi:hypothetical protein